MIIHSDKLKKRLLPAAALIVLVLGGLAAWIAVPPPLEPQDVAGPDNPSPELIARGKYVAELGDCVACHTKPGGAPMAGGLKLDTPFGALWSTNITPDAETGIGRWSYAEFDRAVRKGVRADGSRLYPAMPYPSYAKIDDGDMRALWAYMSRGVTPVEKPNMPPSMSFPFNMRIGLAYWNFAFLDQSPFVPNPHKDEVWNRGAYLVQSLGHCGACHTPRGIGFEEKASSDAGPDGKLYLSGAEVDNWNAVDLRDLWTVPDIVELLKTGQNRFATVSGSMTDVIFHSTQNISIADLTAIATYLKSLPSDKPRPEPEPLIGVVPQDTFTTRGGLGYAQFCTDCHHRGGSGVSGVFPPLVNNPTVSAQDPSTLIHMVLTGWKTVSTAAHPRVFTMPSFARLDDREIAEILTFVRKSWGRGAGPVTEAEIASVRTKLDPKVDATKFEMPRLADLLAEPNATQLIRGMRLVEDTRELLPDHVGNDLNCASCHLNEGTVADASPYIGVSSLFPSYSAREGRVISLDDRINGCFERSMNGKVLPNDSDDMKAMIVYFNWMKGGAKKEDKPPGSGFGEFASSLKPDRENGKRIFAAQCAVCHGGNGEGRKDAAGRVVYPPLWGDRSFNIGAGMSRPYTAAAFVKQNMPVGFREKFPLGEGGLSDQEALDVADYFSQMRRPDFAGKSKDWPKGDKPQDARY
jgi:thiosulfate dehydrogenase